MFMARQGDVLIREVATIPATASIVERDNGRVILAYGEQTGHAHAIMEPTVTKLAHGIAEYLNAPSGACILHEEHDPIILPPGQFEIIHQREYAPAAPVRVRD